MPDLHQELTSDMDRITQLHDAIDSLLTIMSTSITYLVTRTSFKQVNPNIPITKTRPADREDVGEVFEANQREMVNDLVTKAKQIEYLIQSLPPPELEEVQATRYAQLEAEMQIANKDYREALSRARSLHAQVSSTLRMMLSDVEVEAEPEPESQPEVGPSDIETESTAMILDLPHPQ